MIKLYTTYQSYKKKNEAELEKQQLFLATSLKREQAVQGGHISAQHPEQDRGKAAMESLLSTLHSGHTEALRLRSYLTSKRPEKYW